MEDMARLAVVEQSLNDSEKFKKILTELLRNVQKILNDPHDNKLRILRGENLRNIEPLVEYLKYVGYQSVGIDLYYPQEQRISNLKVAKAAIERKIQFCGGSNPQDATSITKPILPKNEKLTPVNVLRTHNALLLRLESLFNSILKYENEELLQLAKQQIPMVTLQLKAIDRMREHQRGIKYGGIDSKDMPFDIAFLLELLGWFKHKFFTWVDRPVCRKCGGKTDFVLEKTMPTKYETCRVGIYSCSCGALTRFPRYNDPRSLLRSRRGRCGEWANCFALMLRALGYDTRYVYDLSDHVWCEVFDHENNTWLHVDPCEGQLNAPLTYCFGWGKIISYVFAVSRDDLQDVTWRYTNKHKEVLKRRQHCNETELIQAILLLREERQKQVSEARRKFLTKRCVQELVQMMVEKKPHDYEYHGRISGAIEWRENRGELGNQKRHVFVFNHPGESSVQYCTTTDMYYTSDGKKIACWKEGVFESHKIFRNVEENWKTTYLAREEGELYGQISWKFASGNEKFHITNFTVKAITSLDVSGRITWTVKYDDKHEIQVVLGDDSCELKTACHEITLTARLSGGLNEWSWRHSQLFRQSLDSTGSTFVVVAMVMPRP